MKKIYLATTILSLAIANFASAATLESTAKAEIIQTIAITPADEFGDGLNFGQITISAAKTGGTVTLLPTNGVVVPAEGLSVLADSASVGKFTVSGEVSASYDFSLEESNITLTKINGTLENTQLTAALALISVNSTNVTSTESPIAVAALSEEGLDTLISHGTLTVPDNAESGAYEGTYNIVVNYN